MTANPDLNSLLTTLRDPQLTPLAEEAVRDYISWDELTERPLPAGMSVAQAWEVLTLIRRFGAFWFPIRTLGGRPFWYTVTREGQRYLEAIEHHCRTDSRLHEAIQEREGHRFLVRSRVLESLAACQLDGVQVDWDSGARMLRDGRSPQTPEERLVLNSYELLGELESYVDQPFSPELAHALYDRLTRNVDVYALELGPVRTNLARTMRQQELGKQDRNWILDAICQYADGALGDPLEPVPVKGYMILSAMAYWHPLPALNDTVARYMLRLFAIKRDYPALGYLPVSLQMRRWFDGEIARNIVRFTRIDRREAIPGEIDGTEDILTYLQLVTAAIDETIAYIRDAQEEDRALQTALDAEEHLNYRQRSVLTRALTHPETEFLIRQHQTAHKVVYQTARTDLLQLVELGYLRQEQRGKAFVFVPVEHLDLRIRGGRAKRA